MTQSKHTPGPWVIFKSGSRSHMIFIKQNQADVNICLISNIQEYEANTYLIAAAPDLLEILDKCFWMIESFDGTSIENEKLIDQARAAIKKAKGE